MTLNDILLYSQISASFMCRQRNFIPPQIKRTTETHRQTFTYTRERETERDFEIQRPKYNVSINFISSELTKPSERRGRKSLRDRGDGGHLENKAL